MLPTAELPHNCEAVLALADMDIDELILATAVGAGVGPGVGGPGVVGQSLHALHALNRSHFLDHARECLEHQFSQVPVVHSVHAWHPK